MHSFSICDAVDKAWLWKAASNLGGDSDPFSE